MHIVAQGDDLHEKSKPIFWNKNKEKYFKMSAEFWTQFADYL